MKIICVLTLFLMLWIQNTTAVSADGPNTLDSEFGIEGKVVNDFGGNSQIFDITLQNDGKIVAVGYANFDDLAVLRYNSDGSLDNNFGVEGRVVTGFIEGDNIGRGVVIQKDGKIVVAGIADHFNFAVARYNSDGSPDINFGIDGKVTIHPDKGGAGFAVALQNDNKIVVAGTSEDGKKFTLLRYNDNGTLDSSFGIDGKVDTEFTGKFNHCYDVAIQSNGKILVVGGVNHKSMLIQYNNNGDLDTNFGIDGKVSDFGGEAKAIALQPDSKIVVVGYSGNNFALVRYNNDGTLDTTFGDMGKAITTFSENNWQIDGANDVAIQADAKIVVVGNANRDDGSFDSDFAVVVYNPDGTPDINFSPNGKVTVDFGNTVDHGNAVAIQPDGRIVMGGSASSNIALARLVGNPPGQPPGTLPITGNLNYANKHKPITLLILGLGLFSIGAGLKLKKRQLE